MKFDRDSVRRLCLLCATLLCVSLGLTGCGSNSSQKPARDVSSTEKDEPATGKVFAPDEGSPPQSSKSKFDAVTLGEDSGSPSEETGTSVTAESQSSDSVVQAMRPLQIMLGKWRGTTNHKFKGGFSAVEELEWVWDFRTDRARPALIVKSDKSPYIREGRLTYLPAEKTFQLTAATPEGVQHLLKGQFEREPEEITGDDNKPQRTYKLLLTEDEPQGDEAWQVAFDQQENNRYLVQVSRKRGTSGFQLIDTVGTQRLGTSFAASDDDYGDKKCIISGGLGTSTVSYNGKSYWVCCSGCQAAFNEDPKRWIAKMEAADKAKTDKN